MSTKMKCPICGNECEEDDSGWWMCSECDWTENPTDKEDEE